LPLIHTVERKLPACAMYLSYDSKLRLVNYVRSSMLMFFLRSLKVYQWVINEVDKYRRQCLWRDKDLHKKTPPLAFLDLVCRQKIKRLGVLNISVRNDCLLMKHLHTFYNKVDLSWVKMSCELYYSTSLHPAR
jgi:hypothetical protein